mmetsp:Transcript_87746/g.237899  ORF Transcript_87746/g.237899 Transcript_87746/m.237899 type:complete len:470 (-) Transcript_87746:44-1453(-)
MQHNLSQVHQSVVHLLAGSCVAILLHQPDRPALEVVVGRRLPRAQRHAHDNLDLRRQAVAQDVRLGPLEQERRQERLQLRNHAALLVWRQRHLVLVEAWHLCERFHEPRVEVGCAREQVRQEVVQERPQLRKAVLHGSACEQQAHLGRQRRQGLVPERIGVLQAVPFVDNDKLPRRLLQPRGPVHPFVVRDADCRPALAQAQHHGDHDVLLAAPRAAPAHEHVGAHGGRQAGELPLPGRDHGLGRHDQVRAGVALRLREAQEQRDRLHGLPEAHLVSQDAVEAVSVERRQPLQPFHLVRHELRLQASGAADAHLHAVHQLRVLLPRLRGRQLQPAPDAWVGNPDAPEDLCHLRLDRLEHLRQAGLLQPRQPLWRHRRARTTGRRWQRRHSGGTAAAARHSLLVRRLPGRGKGALQRGRAARTSNAASVRQPWRVGGRRGDRLSSSARLGAAVACGRPLDHHRQYGSRLS